MLIAMNQRRWEGYPEPAPDKLNYWIDLWQELTREEVMPWESGSLDSVHTVLRELAQELEGTGFINDSERKLAYKVFNRVVREDRAIQTTCKSEIEIIRRYFNSGRTKFLQNMCVRVLDQFGSEVYFAELVRLLSQELFSDGVLNRRSIRSLTQTIILELFIKGYSAKKIQSLAEDLFDTLREETDGTVHTRFPSRTSRLDFGAGPNFDSSRYSAALRTEFEGLNWQTRLNTLCSVFEAPSLTYTVIFPVEGLAGEVTVPIGPATFYPPNSIRKTDLNGEEPFKDAELFGRANDPDAVNVAVTTSAIDMDAARVLAARQAEKALDLVRAYFSTRAPYRIVTTEYICTSDRGDAFVSTSVESNESAFRKLEALDMSRFSLQDRFTALGELQPADFLFRNPSDQKKIERKLSYALRWFRKGEEAARSEDRLLAYWVSIEHLLAREVDQDRLLQASERLTTAGVIREVLPAIHMVRMYTRLGWLLFSDMRRTGISRPPGDPIGAIVQAVMAKGSKTVQLSDFVDQLGQRKASIHETILRDEIENVLSIYTDCTAAKSYLENSVEQMKDDLQIIYQYRNQIVHDADTGDFRLPFFVRKARVYVGTAIRLILQEYCAQRASTVEEVLTSVLVRQALFFAELERGCRNPLELLRIISP
jgi:hypothetical protein